MMWIHPQAYCRFTLQYLAAADKALSASLCLATSEGLAISAHARATTSGGRSKAAEALLLPASQSNDSVKHNLSSAGCIVVGHCCLMHDQCTCSICMVLDCRLVQTGIMHDLLPAVTAGMLQRARKPL